MVIEVRVLCGDFYRRLENCDGIVRRVQGVWVLLFPKYFNGCNLFLKIKNWRSPSGYHIMFMSRKGDILSAQVWTLLLFLEWGIFYLFVHISTIKWRCWFPDALFTIFWNPPDQSLISLTIFFPSNTTIPYLDN